MKSLFIPVFIIFAVTIASCNQGGSVTSLNDGGGSAGMWTIPQVGTAYIFESTPTVSTVPEFDSLTVIQTGQHIGGKTNVISYLENIGGLIDTAFYNIESNGDFSIGSTNANDPLGNPVITWTTYPTGTRLPINVEPAVDSFAANGEHIVRSDVRTFVGVENINVSAGTFSTLHVRETTTNIESFPNDSLGSSVSDVITFDYWFATAVGLFVKTGFNGQTSWNLIKYAPR